METTIIRRIAARPAIVFDALVTSEGIGSWWGPDDFPVLSASADPQVGGNFRVRFRTSDGLEHECTGEFLEILRPARVVMSWSWVGNGPPEEQGNMSRLEFRLRPVGIDSELTLIHSALSSEASARSHQGGWSGGLDKLVRLFAQTRGSHA